jgi:hypothetical protein
MRPIDADELVKDFGERARHARNWKENALNDGNEELAIRATATLDFLTEVKLTIDNAPTVKPSLSLDNISDEDIEKFKLIWQRATSKGLLAEPERPQGEWIETKNDSEDLICPKCETIFNGDIMLICGGEMPNFCPNCGAKMEKGGSE